MQAHESTAIRPRYAYSCLRLLAGLACYAMSRTVTALSGVVLVL
jgi:hypothetical protein